MTHLSEEEILKARDEVNVVRFLVGVYLFAFIAGVIALT